MGQGALHALPGLVCGCVLGCSPLTPDPSPPFHGGEGRILSVARAFQPEICPLRPDAWRLPLRGVGAGGLPHAKTRGVEAAHSLLTESSGSRSLGRRCQGVDTIPTGSAQLRFACGVLIKFDCRHGLCCTAERWRRECAGEAGRSRRSGL